MEEERQNWASVRPVQRLDDDPGAKMSASGRSDDSMYSPWETMGDPSAFPIAHQSTSLLSFPPSILQHCPSFLHSKY
ncbi:hypothetical protein V6N12_046880 [Hibiscus sabdariffa]